MKGGDTINYLFYHRRDFTDYYLPLVFVSRSFSRSQPAPLQTTSRVSCSLFRRGICSLYICLAFFNPCCTFYFVVGVLALLVHVLCYILLSSTPFSVPSMPPFEFGRQGTRYEVPVKFEPPSASCNRTCNNISTSGTRRSIAHLANHSPVFSARPCSFCTVCVCSFVTLKQEALSAAAEARLSALPDLSYMLSQRIRFPVRAADPLPLSATAAESFL